MDVTEVVNMFQAGMSSSDIAMELDVTPKEIRTVLEEYGLLERAGRKSVADQIGPEARKAIVADYTENKIPAIQIISQHGLTWNAFYKILDDEHVPYRQMKQVDKVARTQRLDRAIEMYLGGARLWEIENETGIRQPVLHAELHKRSIPLRRAVTFESD